MSSLLGLFVQIDIIVSPWFRSDTKVTEEIFCETNVQRKVAICKTSSLPYQSRALISNLQEARKHFGLSPSKRNCFSATFTNVELKKKLFRQGKLVIHEFAACN